MNYICIVILCWTRLFIQQHIILALYNLFKYLWDNQSPIQYLANRLDL
jgi:hypothetical protein